MTVAVARRQVAAETLQAAADLVRAAEDVRERPEDSQALARVRVQVDVIERTTAGLCVPARRLPTYSGAALAAVEAKPREEIFIDCPLAYREQVGGVYSGPGYGKSNIVRDLAISLAANKPLAGRWMPVRPGRTLIVAGEEAVDEWLFTASLVAAGKGIDLTPEVLESILLAPLLSDDPDAASFSLGRESDRREIEQIVAEFRPDVVAFDTRATTALGVKMQDEEQALPFMAWLAKLSRTESRPCILLIDHETKGSGSADKAGVDPLDLLFGGRAVSGRLNAAWRITRVSQGSPDLLLHHTKQRGAPRRLTPIYLRTEIVPNVSIRYTVDEEQSASSAAVLAAEVLAFVRANPGCATRAVRKALPKASKAVGDVLRSLVGRHLIEDRGNARRNAYYALEPAEGSVLSVRNGSGTDRTDQGEGVGSTVLSVPPYGGENRRTVRTDPSPPEGGEPEDRL